MFFKLDSSGSVVNEARIAKIQPAYLPVLDELTVFYQKTLGENLKSIYIRGSVSVGLAQAYVSDIDSVALIQSTIPEHLQKEIFLYSQEIQEKYPFVTLVDMTVLTLEALMTNPEFSNLKIYLKTQSVCLYGEDILEKLEEVKPGKALALKMYGDIPEKLEALNKYFLGEGSEMLYLGEKRPVQFWCIWTMRTILRSALGLVMVREPIYSQDLRSCAKAFTVHYPEQEEFINQALRWAKEPTNNKVEIASYLQKNLQKYTTLWREVINDN